MGMTVKCIAIFVPLVLALVSCTYSEPVYVHNNSRHQLTVRFDGQTRRVHPGNTMEIAGLHYHESIKFSSFYGHWTYSGSLSTTPEKLDSYYPGYVCRGFWGTRIDLTFTKKRELILEPCSQGHPRKVLPADYGIAPQVDDRLWPKAVIQIIGKLLNQ